MEREKVVFFLTVFSDEIFEIVNGSVNSHEETKTTIFIAAKKCVTSG